MNQNEKMRKMRECRTQSEVIYDCPEYLIRIIPLNYEIMIKLPTLPQYRSVGPLFYISSDADLKEAHELAEYLMGKFYRRPRK